MSSIHLTTFQDFFISFFLNHKTNGVTWYISKDVTRSTSYNNSYSHWMISWENGTQNNRNVSKMSRRLFHGATSLCGLLTTYTSPHKKRGRMWAKKMAYYAWGIDKSKKEKKNFLILTLYSDWMRHCRSHQKRVVLFLVVAIHINIIYIISTSK